MVRESHLARSGHEPAERPIGSPGSDGSYRICLATVMDTSDPDIEFDMQGYSSHYLDYHRNIAPRWTPEGFGRDKFERIAEEIRRQGRGKDFDCILGLSGGADSSYMLHLAVTEFGLRPLVFHVDGGWNSETSSNNIRCLVDKLGLDLFTEVIDWNEMRDFQLAMFKSGVPHLDIPQDMAFIGVLYKFAAKYGVRNILNGGNISTECVLPPLRYLYWGTDLAQVRDILDQFGTIPMTTYPFCSILYHKLWLRYFRGIRVHKPLNFVPYVKEEAMTTLTRVYGFKSYPQKHFESRFTRFFEGFWLPRRFGFDMRRIQYSSLILTGQMTRAEALLALERPPIDADLVAHEFEFVATKLGISAPELSEYLHIPKRFYWDFRNHRRLFAMGEWILSRFAGTRRGGAA